MISNNHINTQNKTPTRRDYIKYGGSVVTGGLLTGCIGNNGQDSTNNKQQNYGKTGAENEYYSVTISPVGKVEFKSVPDSVFTILAHHADMVLSLGHSQDINAIFNPELFDGLYNRFLERLDGVSVDWTGLYGSWDPAKENLYELDSDIHLADPAYISTMRSWDKHGIEEIRGNISPWFGNTLSGQHSEPPEAWKDKYQYYGLWEIFEKVANVFKEQKKYNRLKEIHSNIVSKIKSNLPPKNERPRAGRILISPSGIEEGVWAYSMNGRGFYRAHTRPVGVEDVFADMQVGTKIDLEALVEAKPDVILRTGGMSPGANWNKIKKQLKNNPVAQKIPAVKNNKIYPLGVRYGGPIMNIFQLEMTAKQIYPEKFGEWPQYNDGDPYPKIPKREQLFDRQKVADIINGRS